MKPQTNNLSFGIGIFISLLVLAVAVFAAGTNTLNVKVVDDTGAALKATKVQILILGGGGKPLQEKKTDNNGTVRFEKLDDGAYRVIARPEKAEPGFYEFAFLKNGAQESVTVKCLPGDPLKQLYFEDPNLISKTMASLKEAEPLFTANKWPEAEQKLKATIEINPTSVDTLYFLGLTYIQQQKWDEAKATWEKDLNILDALVALPQPKDAKGVAQPSPYLGLQKTISSMLPQLPVLKLKVEATDELNKQNFKAAIGKFQEAIKISGNDPDVYYNLALAFARDNQFDGANQALDKAIALKPDDKGYADFKLKLQKFAQASKAKELADQGDKLFNSKDFTNALKNYEQALPLVEDPPTLAALWIVIGRARTQTQQDDAAVEAYKRAIQLAPNDPKLKAEAALNDHYVQVGQRYVNAKQYDRAFAAYAQGGVSIFKLGQEWAKKAETEDLGILAFQQVIKTSPDNADAYFELGSIYYFNKKDYVRAKENLTKFTQLSKDETKLQNAKDILAVIDRKK
jgi:tetratricopeptide (TPR) repeat protein